MNNFKINLALLARVILAGCIVLAIFYSHNAKSEIMHIDGVVRIIGDVEIISPTTTVKPTTTTTVKPTTTTTVKPTTTTTSTTTTISTTTTTLPQNVIFNQDFEGTQFALPHVLSVSEAEDLFGGQSWGNNPLKTFSAGNGVLVRNPVGPGTALEAKHFKGMYALGKTDPAISGVQARPSGITAYMDSNIPDNISEFTFEIKLYFPEGFKFNWAAHMPSMKSGNNVGSSTDPSLFGTFLDATFQMSSPTPYPGSTNSNFELCKYVGCLSIYYYNAEGHQLNTFFNPKDPTNPHDNGRDGPQDEYQQLLTGKWNTLKMYVKLNTKGFGIGDSSGANGVLQAWHNGKLMVDIHDMQWLNDRNRNLRFSRSQIQLWYGGNDMKWAAKEDQSWFIDDIIIRRGLY
jgi:hypothetical protein